MTDLSGPPFRADHVGSLLRPAELLRAREQRAAEDAAIREAVAKQAEAGMRSVTDGEFRRGSWHMDFLYRTGELAVDGYFLEYDDARSGSFAPLRFVPKGKRVVLGLVTTKRPALEAKDALKRRIDEAARYVPLDQLCLSPRCGFSSTVDGNRLSEDEQFAKLRLVAETAREVWG